MKVYRALRLNSPQHAALLDEALSAGRVYVLG